MFSPPSPPPIPSAPPPPTAPAQPTTAKPPQKASQPSMLGGLAAGGALGPNPANTGTKTLLGA